MAPGPGPGPWARPRAAGLGSDRAALGPGSEPRVGALPFPTPTQSGGGMQGTKVCSENSPTANTSPKERGSVGAGQGLFYVPGGRLTAGLPMAKDYFMAQAPPGVQAPSVSRGGVGWGGGWGVGQYLVNILQYLAKYT
jgi:hypothetical protein